MTYNVPSLLQYFNIPPFNNISVEWYSYQRVNENISKTKITVVITSYCHIANISTWCCMASWELSSYRGMIASMKRYGVSKLIYRCFLGLIFYCNTSIYCDIGTVDRDIQRSCGIAQGHVILPSTSQHCLHLKIIRVCQAAIVYPQIVTPCTLIRVLCHSLGKYYNWL